MYKTIINEDKSLEISFDQEKVTVDGDVFDWDIIEVDESSFHIIYKNKSYTAEIISFDKPQKLVTIKINGKKYEVKVKDKLDLLLEKLGMDKLASQQVNDIKAPMPGLVLDILVKEGDEVQKGDQVMILEAMKMENVLKSPGDGTVKSLNVKKGDSVEKNQVMIEF
ncbi:MAG: biotin/lipoyl-containing protein [Fulvivirga sp.]|nr:biotin/lipoyl-containing protein [Fulvivirga sp.]